MSMTIRADAAGPGPYEVKVRREGWSGRFWVRVMDDGVLAIFGDCPGAMTVQMAREPEVTGPEALPTDAFAVDNKPPPPERSVVVERITFVSNHPDCYRVVDSPDAVKLDNGGMYSLEDILRRTGLVEVIIRPPTV